MTKRATPPRETHTLQEPQVSTLTPVFIQVGALLLFLAAALGIAVLLRRRSSHHPARPNGKPIICPNPNCGYRGPSIREARGSAAAGCLLFFLAVLPGILYLLLRSGYRYLCPQCGMQIGTDA